MERLERAPALFMVVAWRIARLMRLGRAHCDIDHGLGQIGRRPERPNQFEYWSVGYPIPNPGRVRSP